MLYGVLPRPDARLLPQVLSPHPAPHPGPRTRPRASAPAPRLALWFSLSSPRIRSSHSCLRTPVSALLPPHSGPHSGPVFRAVHSGLALRPRPAPTFCPALWVADLKGGFWKEAFAFRAQAPVPAFWPCVPALTTRPSQPGPRAPAPRIPPCVGLALRPTHPGSHSGPTLRPRVPGGTALALRARTPVLAHRPPHPALAPGLAPGLALRPTHPGSHSGPVFRAVRSGLAHRSRVPGGALRSRAPTQTCPHILPRALGGGFEGRILEGGFRVPGSSSGPRVLALYSGPHNPVLAPRLLAFRPASTSHFDPRTPARTPVPCSGRCAPVSRSGPVFRAAYPGPVLRPRPAPHILPHALGGGFWRRLLPPGPLPHFVPRSRPRAPAPAFPPRIPGGGFEGRFSGDGFEGGFSGNILERRIPGGCFEGGGLRSGSCVRPRRCVSELRILANRQNKVYL